MKLSATIIAQDEEAMLPDCLASLRGLCDEIVLVDGGSRDRTRELALAAGARVLERPFDDYARQHEFARSEARGEWILSLDADERASPGLSRELGAALSSPVAAFSLPFKNHFRGVWLRHGGLWPDRHVRLYRRDACAYDLSRPVHEKLLVRGQTGALESPILHYTWGSLAQCLAKTSRYAERAAQARFAAGQRAGALQVLGKPAWRFLRAYVLRLGFLDGAAGASVAWMRAFEAYAREARLWELSRFPDAARDSLG